MQIFPKGLGQREYDALTDRMSVRENPPEGLIFHCAGEGLDGRWRVVDVWKSREHFDRFGQERLGHAVDQLIGDQSPEPDSSWWPVPQTT